MRGEYLRSNAGDYGWTLGWTVVTRNCQAMIRSLEFLILTPSPFSEKGQVLEMELTIDDASFEETSRKIPIGMRSVEFPDCQPSMYLE